jgi:hypothetical protein
MACSTTVARSPASHAAATKWILSFSPSVKDVAEFARDSSELTSLRLELSTGLGA